MKVKFYKVLMLTVGNLLPVSYYPFGHFGKKFRYFCAKRIVTKIGERATIEKGVVLQQTMVIGNHAGIGAYSVMSDNVTIGNHVMIGPECLVYTRNHRFNKDTLKYDGYTEVKPVVVEDHAWVGARCTILPGVTIGKGATVGANSVVTKNVPAYTLAAGNPAKVIKKLVDEPERFADGGTQC